MERKVYRADGRARRSHWWFVARRRILAALIERVRPAAARTRGSSRSAAAPATISRCCALRRGRGERARSGARELASERLGRAVKRRRAARPVDVPGGQLRPHRPARRARACRRRQGLRWRAIRTRLKPGGKLLVTVPANPWMWSAHDVAHHHHRRYRKRELAQLARRGRATRSSCCRRSTACCFRRSPRSALLGKLTGKDDSDDAMPPRRSTGRSTRCSGWSARLSGGCRCRSACRWWRFFADSLIGSLEQRSSPGPPRPAPALDQRAGSAACRSATDSRTRRAEDRRSAVSTDQPSWRQPRSRTICDGSRWNQPAAG